MPAANLPGASVVKLVTPRLAPARFAEYLVTLPAGGGTSEPVRAGLRELVYGLAGEAFLETGGIGDRARPGSFATSRTDAGFSLRGEGRLCGSSAGRSRFGRRHAAAVRTATTSRSSRPAFFRRRELLDPTDPRFDFNMSLLAFDPGTNLGKIRSTTRSTAST